MNTEIDAVVFAGGKSSRMGRDKGTMLLNGKPMITYVLNTLQALKLPINILANTDLYHGFFCPIWRDLIQNCGPMGGLYTAMHASKARWLLCLSCDTPFVSAAVLQRLIDSAQPDTISVAAEGDALHPLCALYPRSLLPMVKTALDSSTLKMKEFIQQNHYKKVEMEDLVAEDAYLFYNINCRKDLETSESRWKINMKSE